MTLGEMARSFNGEGWLEGGIQCDLIVIPYEVCHSDAWYPQIAPSPNLPTPESIALYPSSARSNLRWSASDAEPQHRLGVGMRRCIGFVCLHPQPVPGAARIPNTMA